MVLSMCQTNCYFVSPENQKEVVLIDPADQGGQIYEALKSKGLQVAAILLTTATLTISGAQMNCAGFPARRSMHMKRKRRSARTLRKTSPIRLAARKPWRRIII